MASGKKRKRNDSSASGAGAVQLPVLSLDSFAIVASFVDGKELRSMSCANHAAFDMLQDTRVKLRAERDASRVGMINEDFDDVTGQMQYYRCIESFNYQFLLGRLMLETAYGDDFAQAILHGPVLEHLLTLCGTNLQLARNVVANYTWLYNVTSTVDDDVDEIIGWLTDQPGLRMDDSELCDRGKQDDNGLWTWFNRYFDKTDFPGMDAYTYVWYLIRDCGPVFVDIQCMLSLRMRYVDACCELGACENLLEDMHMTTTLQNFHQHLLTFHMESVRQRIARAEVEFDAYLRMNDEDQDGTDSLSWYQDIAPAGIYLHDRNLSYAFENQR